MKLEDFPQFTIQRITGGPDDMRLHGTFDKTRGLSKQGCFLFQEDDFFTGDLTWFNKKTGQGVIKKARYMRPEFVSVKAGETYPCIYAGVTPQIIAAVLGPENAWKRVQFEATDAQAFIEEGAYGWWKAENGVPEGAEPVEVLKGGWDHEHCDICWETIEEGGVEYGYRIKTNLWLCPECYNAYAVTHDLSFAKWFWDTDG